MHFVFNQFIIVKNENLFDEFVTVTNLQKVAKHFLAALCVGHYLT